MEIDNWKKIFSYAMLQIKQSNIPNNSWSFGGGTVLMQKFNHRFSKDIDIFFRDKQLFSYVSPRVNDALEDILVDFVEQDNFTKLYLPNGEIDFIYSPQVTNCKPDFKSIENIYLYVDSPIEIVAKKIEYRFEEFKPRDVFDLAIVYSKMKDNLVKNIPCDKYKLDTLKNRINDLEISGILNMELESIHILPGAKEIKGKEIALCKDFLNCMEKKIQREKYFSHAKTNGLSR